MSDLGEIAYLEMQELSARQAEMTNDGAIKGQVILTQAEYDALTTEEQGNGKIYLIRED